ncbi:unnamed protein product [Effrenium voratum]|uniref:Glycosyltransferase family 28 N-terminal domain-containing protein n=1 Tax=Effrenium voratum TaxID=2562239 RepID=A0AA36JRU7_9DINO|nr:unnamed protein product [Effrenium voratum]
MAREVLFIRLGSPAITNLPVKTSTLEVQSACCNPSTRGVFLQVSETRCGDAGDLYPAVWQIKGGEHNGSTGVVTFQDRRAMPTDLEAKLRFEILDDSDSLVSAVPWAFADVPVSDLAHKPRWELLLSHTDNMEAVYGNSPEGTAPEDVRPPAFLHLEVSRSPFASEPEPQTAGCPSSNRDEATPRKKVMLITRGTRGDVQPFVALARGLVLNHGCEVVIVTELRCKEFVKKNGEDLPIRLRFRPSGGDTTLKVKTRTARLAMTLGQHSDALQALMLSRSEVEFFPSEGCVYHWAKTERPDFIVFGFTMTHIAMIVSESLRIPLVGFVLQPARGIERMEYSSRVIGDAMAPLSNVLTGVEFQAFLQQTMERLPSSNTLNSLRRSRALAPCPANIDTEDRQSQELLRQGVPRVVPISRELLQDSQVEEMEAQGLQLTNFIFLDERPSEQAVALLGEVSAFIQQAKDKGRSVLAMTFSSMPVGKAKMLSIGEEVAQHGVACIVLAAGQPEGPPLSKTMKELQKEGLLMVVDGPVPFSQLFPKVDVAILHGGLGVTSEALRAGIPVITSGILLMDQRFWAARLFEKGCGSKAVPVHTLAKAVQEGILESVIPAEKA